MSALKAPALLALLLAGVPWLAAPAFAGGGQAAPQEAAAEEEAGAADGEVEAREDPSATGDAWVDARVADINEYGRRHRDPFVDELARYHEAPRALVAELLDERDWAPGEVYFACALARVVGRPCRFVADQRGQAPVLGWNALATGLDAGPGSEAFARLKRGIVRSYERWARPLELDAELAAADGEG